MNLLKKIQLVRKAFLTKSWRRYYSQFGEDAILRELLRKKSAGIFVDVGCFHPTKFSNTYWLYKRGWRGINIDMEPQKIALFNLVRPHDVNIVAAVSNTPMEMVIQKNKDYDLGASLVSDQSQEGERITTRLLTEIIDETIFKDRPVDLLTVDAEGMDLEVLQSLDFARYKPALVIVEQIDASVEEIIDGELHLLLTAHGYKLRSWVVHSLIYEK